MKIIHAKWTPLVNILTIRCQCGNIFEHKSYKWDVKCTKCLITEKLSEIREEYARREPSPTPNEQV